MHLFSFNKSTLLKWGLWATILIALGYHIFYTICWIAHLSMFAGTIVHVSNPADVHVAISDLLLGLREFHFQMLYLLCTLLLSVLALPWLLRHRAQNRSNSSAPTDGPGHK